MVSDVDCAKTTFGRTVRMGENYILVGRLKFWSAKKMDPRVNCGGNFKILNCKNI